MGMKPYQQIPIQECGEAIAPIPLDAFCVVTPHPYAVLGAPYGERSPYWLRETVIKALLAAQEHLRRLQPGWQLQIFDAYRPIPVQQFMVDYTAQTLAHRQGVVLTELDASAQADIWREVYQFWALPSQDPQTPPPHSTGAAIDLTLVDAEGIAVDMGSPIDEVSPRSHPNYFQHQTDATSLTIQAHRQILQTVMLNAGFCQHPNEWWHFSRGDQLWAWQRTQVTQTPHVAHYGRVDV